MAEHGPKKWSLIASKLKTKGSKQVSVRVRGSLLRIDEQMRTYFSFICHRVKRLEDQVVGGLPLGLWARSGVETCCESLTVLPASCYCHQCRRRWKNFLNAELKSGGWSPEVRASKGRICLYFELKLAPKVANRCILQACVCTHWHWLSMPMSYAFADQGRIIPHEVQ